MSNGYLKSEAYTEEDELDDEMMSLEGLEESHVHCHKCLVEGKYVKMVIFQKGRTNDDLVTILICPICRYQEKE